MIEVERITFAYPGAGDGNAAEPVFCDFSLRIEPGQFVALLGNNGSGKSSLGKLLNGLLLPGQGRVTVDGLSTADEANAWEIRRLVGMVFQDPSRQLVAAVVEDDVAFGLENLGLPRSEIAERVDDILARLDITQLRRSEPHYLSGGQKQRVALAGVLVMHPKYLVLDEPTAMLDPRGRRSVVSMVRGLQRDFGLGVVYITHHMDEAICADRVVVLEHGSVVADTCDPSSLFRDVHLLPRLGLRLPPLCSLSLELHDCFVAELDFMNCKPEELAAALAERIVSNPNAPIFDEAQPELPPLEVREPGEPLIAFRGVSYTYMPNTPFATLACQDVTLDIISGECLGIIGATGSGKSTLLQLCNGLLRSTEGTVT
ncbi:energy-coupling factor transporter ATPase, partial [bacterium]|nr:energy-coupling factor transporter ATPase [bacterium]